MKSKIIYIMMALVASVALAGCTDDSTDNETWVVYYPSLVLVGDATVYLDKGSDYVEPGYTATNEGQDVSDQVVVSGSVDGTTSGIYTITYSISNSDGYSASTSRTVIVLDPNDEVEGIYLTDPSSYRLYSGAQVVYGGSYQILIINYGSYYYVDDLLGGWYRDRAGYGDNYAMQGYISVNEDYSIELLDSYVSGWGDSAEFMSDGTFDPSSGTLSWMIEYTTYPMDFYVTMYKQ